MKYNAVKTNSMSELIEAIELFKELGYKRPDWLKDRKKLAECVFIDKDHEIITGRIIGKKEITLPELRDMVVLKRNSIEDATHTTTDDVWKFYIGHDTYCYERKNGVVGWHKEDSKCYGLKPIEKKEMKEFLVKTDSGNYLYAKNVSDILQSRVTEIPDGCNIITCQDRMGSLVYFHWKSLDSDEFFLKDEKIWSNNFGETLSDFIEKNEGDVVIIWQRHTQPEELPFIDDEPKPDTPMAYMEREFERDQCMENARREGLLGDPRIGAPHNPYDDPRIDTYKSEFEIEPPISLNNQYAEIEKVRQDNVNHPSHYTNGKVECIDALESATVGKRGIEAVCVANVIKYLWRYEDKNGIEDIKKAKWYLEKLINTLE